MNDIDRLIAVVEAYARAKGLAEATVSSRFLGRGGRFAELRVGSDIGSRTVHRLLQQFSNDWPADAEWPVDVVRPAPALPAEAAP